VTLAGTVAIFESLLERLTEIPPAGAGVVRETLRLPVWLMPIVAGPVRVTAPGGVTVTFAVVSPKPGAVTWITAVPALTLVICTLTLLVLALTGRNEGMVATAGLLELSVNSMPPAGAGVASSSVRVAVLPLPRIVMSVGDSVRPFDTLSEYCFVAVWWVGVAESVTETFTVLVPAAVGVPLMTPVEGAIVTPAGRPLADHVRAPVPPTAATVAVYATLTLALGSVAVVIVKTGFTVRVKVFDAVKWVGAVASVTVTVTELVPATGVPEIVPVPELMLSSAGKPVADHTYGVTPPVAASGAEYAVPATPAGSVAVVIETPLAWETVRVNCFVAVWCVGAVESVTVQFRVLVPTVGCAPVSAPVVAFSVSQDGIPVQDQDKGAVPPVAARVAL